MPITVGGTNITFNSGSVLQDQPGTAPSYLCRAWVNFNNGAIRASGNVTSVTRNGTGDYTVNFTTAMSDANYCAVSSGQSQSELTTLRGVSLFGVPVAGSTRLRYNNGVNGIAYDVVQGNIGIFR